MENDQVDKCNGCGWVMAPQWDGGEHHWDECLNPECEYDEDENKSQSIL